jgi:hypothetical protein
MKLEFNDREIYLTLLAINDKYGQLTQLPTPIGDRERAEYAELAKFFNEALEKIQKEVKK